MDQSGASGHQSRILLNALPDSMGIMHYYYADELPGYIFLFKVLAVLCFVFATETAAHSISVMHKYG